MQKKWILLLAALVLTGWIGTASGDDMGDLQAQIKQLQARIQQLEAQGQSSQKSIDQAIKELEAQSKAGLPESLAWAEKISFKGDFRYRHETIEAEDDGRMDRHRNRVRARIGMKAKVNDEFDIAIRLASGSADPVSANQTMGDSFSSKDIWLDRMYLTYHPEAISGLDVLAGKMANPFYVVGKSQLIWDGDLNPEGVAASYSYQLNDTLKAFANGGGFWVDENSGAVDPSVWGAQAGLTADIESVTLTAGASYYNYGNVDGGGALWDGDFFGNNTDDLDGDGDGDVFATDFDMVELFAEAKTQIGSMPVAVFGDYVDNTAASSENAGYLVGITLNKTKAPGSWQAGYDYRDLENDAVVGTLCDSDFAGGGTGGKGHKFAFGYQISKNVKAAATYFLNERNETEDDYRRLQLDIELKF